MPKKTITARTPTRAKTLMMRHVALRSRVPIRFICISPRVGSLPPRDRQLADYCGAFSLSALATVSKPACVSLVGRCEFRVAADQMGRYSSARLSNPVNRTVTETVPAGGSTIDRYLLGWSSRTSSHRMPSRHAPLMWMFECSVPMGLKPFAANTFCEAMFAVWVLGACLGAMQV